MASSDHGAAGKMVFIAGGTGRLGTRVVGLLMKRRMRLRVLARDRWRAAHLRQAVGMFERVNRKKGKVSHVPLAAIRVMSILMRPINPAIARLTQVGILMDTMDMTWDPSANRER